MSTLHVENLKGLSSGGNANKVIIPSGQTLQVTDNIRHDDMPTGSIIQTVSARFTTDTLISTGGFTSVGSLSITPKFSNSKIYINTANHLYVQSGTSATWKVANAKLLRDSTVILEDGSTGYGTGEFATDGADRFMQIDVMEFVDTPSTTSSVAYSIQYNRRDVNVTGIRLNHPNYGRQGFMLLQEIKQ